jgi:lysophospholipase L1-like esterase
MYNRGMKISLLIIFLALLTAFLYPFYVVSQGKRVAKTLVDRTAGYQKNTDNFDKSLLVLGDSTAVGVGTNKSEESIPALLANDIGATYVENKAVSGSVVADIETQLQNLSQDYYEVILIQIGGNDIVARHNVKETGEVLGNILKKLPNHDRVLVLMCGDVGTAPIIPWYLRSYYSRKNSEFHAVFEEVVAGAGGQYVNLFIPRAQDPFVHDPKKYFAADSFHPSAAGYAVWYSILKEQL